MASSPNYTLPSPDISDVMSLLCAMKKQNEDILAQNKEILTKLNSIEDDNQKLRQELLEIKSSQNLNHNHNNSDTVSSKKRHQSEDEAEHENEPSNSNNKKARVSVGILPQPEPPASFDSLDDDCLGNVLDFVGKSCYSVFGLVNKRCHEMFCSKGYPKETYRYGYGPLHLIQQEEGRRPWYYDSGCSKGVLHYNRRDIFEYFLADENEKGYWKLKRLCDDAITESRLDILREVFQRANAQKLKYLRNLFKTNDLCCKAARCGKLECLKFLRENEVGLHPGTWFWAKLYGHEHILDYLRNNGYPTEWQD